MPLRVGAYLDGFLTVSNDLSAPKWPAPVLALVELAQGTGSGQVDVAFADTRTLTSGSSESLDLTGTALDNVFGADLALVKVKLLYIKSALGNTTVLTVGNVTNGITLGFGGAAHTWAVDPDGVFLATYPGTGWTVTAGTGDLLKIANASGASATYDIIILGTSA